LRRLKADARLVSKRETSWMNVVDQILNWAGLLIWVVAQLSGAIRPATASRKSLVSTLQRTGGPPRRQWGWMIALILLVLLRAVVYWQVGSAADWTPHLDIGIVAFPFRSDFLGMMIAYSFASFLSTLAVFYLSLLLFSVTNRNETAPNSWREIVWTLLGPIGRWPVWAQLCLPFFTAAILWGTVAPALARAGFILAARSRGGFWEEGAVFGMAVYLVWEYLVLALLLLELVNNYIYLGDFDFWEFVHGTCRALLRPLRWFPLRWGPVDFAPLLALGIVAVLGHFCAEGVSYLYRYPVF